MKPLPEGKIDTTDWKPFIKNQWFRNNFMYFVYCLQAVFLISSIIFGVWHFSNTFIKVGLFICTYVIHELLHMIVIYKAGDISITHSGIFLWITSGAVPGKLQFFVFMSLPFIGLEYAFLFHIIQGNCCGYSKRRRLRNEKVDGITFEYTDRK